MKKFLTLLYNFFTPEFNKDKEVKTETKKFIEMSKQISIESFSPQRIQGKLLL